ncbi:hypothetical protein Tco_1530979 [Tanacetum coccineum]
MKMEVLLEPTSNKLMVEHGEFDESNTHVLERFYTSAGNPVNEILLKLNLPDHRKLKDGGEEAEALPRNNARVVVTIAKEKILSYKGYIDPKQGPTSGIRANRGTLTRPRLKRKKTGKETKPSKKAKSTRTSKGTTKLQPNLLASLHKQRRLCLRLEILKCHRILENACVDSKPTQKWLSNLAKAEKPSKTFDDLMSTLIDFSAFAMNRLQISDLTQDILVGTTYKLLKGTCRSYVELEYNMEECYKALNDQLDWNNPEGDRYPFDISKPLPLVESRNLLIVPGDYFFNNDLAYLQGGSTDKTYTTSLTKTNAAKYDFNKVSKHDVYSTKIILAVTNVKVNVWYGNGHLEEIETLQPNGEDIVHGCNLNDSTLISVQDKLKDMLNNLEMGNTSVMSRRRWSNLDKKRSRIMVKDIDHKLLERRLLRSLEKFVCGREYREDLRLLQQTI